VPAGGVGLKQQQIHWDNYPPCPKARPHNPTIRPFGQTHASGQEATQRPFWSDSVWSLVLASSVLAEKAGGSYLPMAKWADSATLLMLSAQMRKLCTRSTPSMPWNICSTSA